jgi:pimeloyl-ACP methyl ester carboxylesterase
MPTLRLLSSLQHLAALGQAPVKPWRTWWRTTGHRFRPPQVVVHTPRVERAQSAVRTERGLGTDAAATILVEEHRGEIPTIVLGGFVPHGPEQVYLLRGSLIQQGSLYYFNYPPNDFSAELIFAQLDDLIEELSEMGSRSPVILAVSYGAGLVLEWLKRARRRGTTTPIRGLVLVSPVTCIEDLLPPGAARPTTLLGRAIQPYLDHSGEPSGSQIERSRAIFTKMFEAGAQNGAALRGLLTPREMAALITAVRRTIQSITEIGAQARVQCLRSFEPPNAYFSQALLPLCPAPTLILYAEKESAVLTDQAPSFFVFQSAHRAYFPQSSCRIVTNPGGGPVQHASLLFHSANFLPFIHRFYRRLKKRETDDFG